MNKSLAIACTLVRVMVRTVSAQEPEWSPRRIEQCRGACLLGIIDGYMNAIVKHDTSPVPPLARDVRMPESTARVEVVDEQKGPVAAFSRCVYGGARRGASAD